MAVAQDIALIADDAQKLHQFVHGPAGTVPTDNGDIVNMAFVAYQANQKLLKMGLFLPVGEWATETDYVFRNIVEYEYVQYMVLSDHVSSVFGDDLAAGKLTVFQDTMPAFELKEALASIDTGFGVDMVSRAKKHLNTLTALDSEPGHVSKSIYVRGNVADGDGAQGVFTWNPTLTDAPIFGYIHQVTGVVVGRWVRHISGPTNVKAFGALGDGITIDTKAFQAADDNVANWYVPEGVYIIGAVLLNSNRSIEFLAGAEIRGQTAAQGGPATMLFFINGKSNITIKGNYNLLWMNKSDYPVFGYNHAITIFNSQNVSVKKIVISGAGGDGIAIGGGDSPVCDNIWVTDCLIDNASRNGATIQNAQNSGFIRCVFSNTLGFAPGFGLDIEPNPLPAINLARNILVKDCIFFGNYSHGIGLTMSAGPVRLDNNVCYDNGGSGIYAGGVETVTGIVIVGGHMYGNARSGVQLSVSDGVQILGVISEGNTLDGFTVVASTNTIIDGCVSKNNDGLGYQLLGTDNHDVTLSRNSSTGDNYGILIPAGSGHVVENNIIETADLDGIRLTGCTDAKVRNNDVSGSVGGYGIFTNNSTDTVIEGNVLKSNHYGLRTSAGSVRPIVRNNVLYNNGNFVGSSYPANIWFDNTTGPVIMGNISRLTQAPVVNMFGIYVASGVTDGSIQGNDAYQSGSTIGIYITSGVTNGGNRNFDGSWSMVAN